MTEFRHYSEFRQFESDWMWHYCKRIRDLIPSLAANLDVFTCSTSYLPTLWTLLLQRLRYMQINERD